MDIIDQYHGDPAYAHLHVLTRTRPAVREMLKTANFEGQKSSLESLPSTAFAWEDERRYPIHTKEDTLASILYRSKCASSVPDHVDKQLTNAARIYGISRAVFSDTKEAEAPKEPTYALPEDQRLPLDSPAQIKVAEQVLTRDYAKLTLEKRTRAFCKLAKASNDQQLPLSDLTRKMAGMTISSTRVLRDWLEARATAAENTLHKEAYDKLSDALKTMPAQMQDRDKLIKLASTIDTIDRKAGLQKYYNKKLPDPLQTVFNTAKQAELTCDVAGTPVPCQTLMALPPEIWEQVDAPEVAEVAMSGDEAMFKQVFDTLPLDIKIVLGQQLNG